MGLTKHNRYNRAHKVLVRKRITLPKDPIEIRLDSNPGLGSFSIKPNKIKEVIAQRNKSQRILNEMCYVFSENEMVNLTENSRPLYQKKFSLADFDLADSVYSLLKKRKNR